ncbi:MAG TPA: NAD(P)/FAD-dependent oxidoreductase [Actinomycetota bacterium]|nr:NAD(P)/FAD-dependent oxidoreductase [Actinomycetota bacterium]
MPTPGPLDAVIVGAGHNGLVAAAYLARAGRSVTVLERRGIVGGACVTEEIAPGIRTSSGAYSLSLLRPEIWQELELARRGLTVIPKDPQLFIPLPGRGHLFIWRDAARTREELERFSPDEADGYERYNAFWAEAIALLRPLLLREAPSLAALRTQAQRAGQGDVFRLAVEASAAEVVERFFATDVMRGAFVTQGVIGTAASPRHPGTAYVMAHHLLGGVAGIDGTWGYVVGGMGSVTAAIADAAREAGASIRTDAPVEEILPGEGVRLVGGEVVRARVVLSNADPKRTFIGLLPDGALPSSARDAIEAIDTRGSVIKVNLALGELPRYVGLEAEGVGPQHRGTVEICPSVDYLQRSWAQADAGDVSDEPFMEVFCSSSVDDSLAPPGIQVLSCFAQYAPQGDRSRWDEQRDAAGDAVIATLARYAPNVPGAIVAREVLGPPDIEERFGLTGGNIFHGEILPGALFGERPVPGWGGGARTPVPGLYLCGSGAHPGGGVMGAPGRNAATAVLEDLAREDG